MRVTTSIIPVARKRRQGQSDERRVEGRNPARGQGIAGANRRRPRSGYVKRDAGDRRNI